MEKGRSVRAESLYAIFMPTPRRKYNLDLVCHPLSFGSPSLITPWCEGFRLTSNAAVIPSHPIEWAHLRERTSDPTFASAVRGAIERPLPESNEGARNPHPDGLDGASA